MNKSMFKLFIILFSLAFIIINCNSVESKSTDKIDINFLIKEWKRSFEEETDSVQIFRPSDYKEFPPARFRQTYDFMEDYTCKYLVLSPNDAHYFEEGTWRYDSENKILEITTSQNNIVIKYRITNLSEDLLTMISF